jgi:aspartate kinase
MQALAEAGAKVLNAQAVEFARRAGIAIHAQSTFESGTGTRVAKAAAETRRVTGVAADAQMARVVLEGADPTLLTALLSLLGEQGAKGSQVTYAAGTAFLSLPLENVHGLGALKVCLEERFGSRISVREGLGRVTAVGLGINADDTNLLRSLEALAAAGIAVDGIRTSSLAISMEVPGPRLDDATRALHEALLE